MFFWNKFCGMIIFFLIFSVSSYAQNSNELLSANPNFLLKSAFFKVSDNNKLFLSDKTSISFNNRAFLKRSKNHPLHPDRNWEVIGSNQGQKPPIFFPNKITDISEIPSDYAICRYGFFCRQELKIEKRQKFLCG
jgi:hypothetical protein